MYDKVVKLGMCTKDADTYMSSSKIMNKKVLKFFVLLFLTTVISQVSAQEQSKIMNSAFDNVVIQDTDIEVEQIEKLPNYFTYEPEENNKLSYNSEMKLWDNNLKEILDNPKFSEDEKVSFIEDALEDRSRDAFESINSRAIDFWRTSVRAKELIHNYFEEKKFSESDNVRDRFKYFEFKTKSLYPETLELITEYFKNRPDKENRYKYEGDLIYRLIQLNHYKEAISYLELIVNENIEENTIIWGGLGGRDTQLYEGHVFDFLCFAENSKIRRRATDLLFKLLENKDFNTYELYPLSLYLDKNRHIKMLEKRFDYYQTIDFTPLKDFKTNPATKNNRYQILPEAESFYSFMYTNSLQLGPTKGKELWAKFKETMPYWELYGQPFEMSQIYILENSFKDISLTKEDKIRMLKEAQISDSFFSDRDLYGSYKARYLNLLVETFPNKKVPKDIFDELGLNSCLSFSTPLNISEHDLKVTPFREKLKENKIDSVILDINTYASTNNLPSLELTEKDRFLYSLKSPESLIFSYFHKNNRMCWFDSEGSEVPTNYKLFYENQFKNIIETNTKLEPVVFSESKGIDNEKYEYHVYISFEKFNLVHKYQEYGTDWYTPQRLVKPLNLILIKSDTDKRLVEIESGDQSAIFIVANPFEIKSLLSKYSINCWAIKYGDEFHNQ